MIRALKNTCSILAFFLFSQTIAVSQSIPGSPRVSLHPMTDFETSQYKAEMARERQAMLQSGGTRKAEVADPVTHVSFVGMGVDGARRLNTVISVINSSKQTVRILVEFFGIDGRPLLLPFEGPNGGFGGYFASAFGELGPGVEAGPSTYFRSEPAKFGWARITYDVPDAIGVSSFLSIQDPLRTGVVVHKSGEPVFSPVEIGIENSPSYKTTWISMVNPGDETLELRLTARRGDGGKACETHVKIEAGQMVWKTAQSLIPCQRPGMPNYTLHIEPMNGAVLAQAYYDYGNLAFATAPVHDAIPDEMAPMQTEASGVSGKVRAATAVCRPVFDPVGLKLSSDEEEFEVSMDFSGCNPDQNWIVRKSTSGSTWFTLANERDQNVSAISGIGTANIKIKVDAAAAKKYSGTRRGTIYVNSFVNGRVGTTIALYQFTQPIPKL